MTPSRPLPSILLSSPIGALDALNQIARSTLYPGLSFFVPRAGLRLQALGLRAPVLRIASRLPFAVHGLCASRVEHHSTRDRSAHAQILSALPQAKFAGPANGNG